MKDVTRIQLANAVNAVALSIILFFAAVIVYITITTKGNIEEKTVVEDIDGVMFKFKFEMNYSSDDFDVITDLKILMNGDKEPLASTRFFYLPNTTKQAVKLFADSNLQIYQSYGLILYKQQNKFYELPPVNNPNDIVAVDEQQKKNMIYISRILREKYGWKYILWLGPYSIRLGDETFINDYKRLVTFQITDEEKNQLNSLYSEELDWREAIPDALETLRECGIQWF